MAIFIQTVYLPAENLRYLDEWLNYHLNLGIDHFYLYDNTGSTELDLGNSVSVNGLNKYGRPVVNRDVTAEEHEILKRYPVTKIKWQPVVDGRIIYGQMLAATHFSQICRSGLCAFIDTDEFIIKREAFRESRLYQRKFEDRWNYERATDCKRTFYIDTRRWGSKCVLDMSRFRPSTNIHFPELSIPESASWFNHYNHNEIGHAWLLANSKNVDPKWIPVPYDRLYIEIDDPPRDEDNYAKFVARVRNREFHSNGVLGLVLAAAILIPSLAAVEISRGRALDARLLVAEAIGVLSVVALAYLFARRRRSRS